LDAINKLCYRFGLIASRLEGSIQFEVHKISGMGRNRVDDRVHVFYHFIRTKVQFLSVLQEL
jgi:hypothetical protein